MCCKRGATILAKVEARPGESTTIGRTHPQEREAKERTGELSLVSTKQFRSVQFSLLHIGMINYMPKLLMAPKELSPLLRYPVH